MFLLKFIKQFTKSLILDNNLMNKLPINIDIDWDNVITYDSTSTPLKTKENVINEYGPPLDFFSSFRELIEDESMFEKNKNWSLYLKRFFDKNHKLTQKNLIVGTNILKMSYVFGIVAEECDSDGKCVIMPRLNTKYDTRKYPMIKRLYTDIDSFKINIGEKSAKIYEIITNNQIYEEYLNWWCQFIKY